jgi:hypothetical protein
MKLIHTCPCGAEFSAKGKGPRVERTNRRFDKRHVECRIAASVQINEARPVVGFHALAVEEEGE